MIPIAPDLTRRRVLAGAGAMLAAASQPAAASPDPLQVEIGGRALVVHPFQKGACRVQGNARFSDEKGCAQPGGWLDVMARRSRGLSKPVVVTLSVPGAAFGLVLARATWEARSERPCAVMIDGTSFDPAAEGLAAANVPGQPVAVAVTLVDALPPGPHAVELVFACAADEDRAWRLHGWLSDSVESAAGERPCP